MLPGFHFRIGRIRVWKVFRKTGIEIVLNEDFRMVRSPVHLGEWLQLATGLTIDLMSLPLHSFNEIWNQICSTFVEHILSDVVCKPQSDHSTRVSLAGLSYGIRLFFSFLFCPILNPVCCSCLPIEKHVPRALGLRACGSAGMRRHLTVETNSELICAKMVMKSVSVFSDLTIKERFWCKDLSTEQRKQGVRKHPEKWLIKLN
jgi:hypothetical protein